MAPFYNCHIHTFTSQAAPPRFLPFFALPLARSRVTGPAVGWLLRNAWPGKSDGAERLAAFATIGRMKDQEAVFDHVRGFYSDEFRFVVHTLDMDYMGAGRPNQPYVEQLAEAVRLRDELGDVVRPFVCADPRRPDIDAFVREWLEMDDGCVGIKLYPNLGFWPTDEDLDPVFAYAEEHGVPVLTHCSRGGIHYRGPIVPPMRRHHRTDEYLRGGRKELFGQYSDPDGFIPVLEKYPSLRLCFAHYGGGEEWRRYLTYARPVRARDSWIRKINDILEDGRFPNVYVDVSSVAADPSHLPLLTVLAGQPETRDRMLFGSDFFMIQRDVTERQFGLGLRAAVGAGAWERIASTNPEAWLGDRA